MFSTVPFSTVPQSERRLTGLSPASSRRIHAAPSVAPACRLARISVAVSRTSSDPTTAPLVWVYRIEFVDGEFSSTPTVQTATVAARDASGTIYAAAARSETERPVGALVWVTWHNGQWWILDGPALRVITATALETRMAAADVTAQFADADGREIVGWWFGGGVVAGWEYYLINRGTDWFVLNPTRSVLATAQADAPAGSTGLFRLPDEDLELETNVSAVVYLGPVSDGQNYIVEWVQSTEGTGQWVALGDASGGSGFPPSLLGTCSAFVSSGNGTFSTSLGTISAALGRGLCLAGRTYILHYTNSAWVVADPELTVLVKSGSVQTAGASASVTVYAGTAGSEATTSNSISAYLRKGLLFTNPFYEAEWVENGWKIVNPSLEFVGTAAADIALDASVSQLIHTGSLGGESSSGTSVTVRNSYGAITNGQRVRCAWSDWPSGGGWEYVNARCP